MEFWSSNGCFTYCLSKQLSCTLVPKSPNASPGELATHQTYAIPGRWPFFSTTAWIQRGNLWEPTTNKHGVILNHICLVVYPPLWKIWVRQLGWWNSQYIENIKCSKPPTKYIEPLKEAPSVGKAGFWDGLWSDFVMSKSLDLKRCMSIKSFSKRSDQWIIFNIHIIHVQWIIGIISSNE